MKTSRWLPLAAFFALAALLAAGVWMSRNPDRDVLPSPLIGKPAPEFALPILHEPTRTVRLADLRGQPFLLNVWGSWCVECRVEHPVLTRFAETKRLRECWQCGQPQQQGKDEPHQRDASTCCSAGINSSAMTSSVSAPTCFQRMMPVPSTRKVSGAP